MWFSREPGKQSSGHPPLLLAASLTAVHLIRGILTVHELVAAAGVPNAGAVPATEFTQAAGRLCKHSQAELRHRLIGAQGPKLSKEGCKWRSGAHSLLQGISSEPSPQSSAPLHHSMLDTQRPLLHWRKVFLQRRESVWGSRPESPGKELPPLRGVARGQDWLTD